MQNWQIYQALFKNICNTEQYVKTEQWQILNFRTQKVQYVFMAVKLNSRNQLRNKWRANFPSRSTSSVISCGLNEGSTLAQS